MVALYDVKKKLEVISLMFFLVIFIGSTEALSLEKDSIIKPGSGSLGYYIINNTFALDNLTVNATNAIFDGLTSSNDYVCLYNTTGFKTSCPCEGGSICTVPSTDTIYYIDFGQKNAILNCSDDNATDSVNFYFYEEESLSAMYGNVTYAIETVTGYYHSYNISINNVTNFSVCIYGSSQTVNMTMVYSATGYDQRTYYFFEAELTPTVQNINLYNIPSASSEKVETFVKDANDRIVEDAYVNIQRYYVSENLYRTIMIGKTDSEGKFISYLYPDTIFYKYIISLDGVVSSSSGPMTLTDTTDDPEILTLYTGSEDVEFYVLRESTYGSCYVNFTTNYTICTVADSTGLFTSATLKVQKTSLSGFTDICTDDGSGSAFTLSCYLGTNPTGQYRYMLYATPDPNPIHILTSDTFSFGVDLIVERDFGLFLSMLLMLTIVMVGIVFPPLAGVLAVIGLAASAALGLMEVGLSSLIGLMIVAVIIFMKSKGVSA